MINLRISNISKLFLEKNITVIFIFDKNCNFEKSLTYDAVNAKWVETDITKIDEKHQKKCIIAIYPGIIAIRKIKVSFGSDKEILAAAVTNFSDSFVESIEDSYLEKKILQISPDKDQSKFGNIFQISKKYLSKCTKQCEKLGFTPLKIIVPELLYKNDDPVFLLYYQNNILYFYYIYKKIPLIAESIFCEKIITDNIYELINFHINKNNYLLPENVIIWSPPPPDDDEADDDEVTSKLKNIIINKFNINNIYIAKDFQGVLPLLDTFENNQFSFFKKNKGLFSEFTSFLEDRPIDTPQKKKLFISVFIAIICSILFLFSFVIYHEKKVSILNKEVEALQITANQSLRAAKKIKNLTFKINILKKYTKDKPSMVHMIRDLSYSKPNDVKFKSISISPFGAVIIQGTSKNDISLTDFLDNLNTLDMVHKPRLTSMRTNQSSGVVSFVIHSKSPIWKKYYKKHSNQ